MLDVRNRVMVHGKRTGHQSAQLLYKEEAEESNYVKAICLFCDFSLNKLKLIDVSEEIATKANKNIYIHMNRTENGLSHLALSV